ncbi:hypothetical protein MXD81_50325 [Microbacteriaceae bacterium K1510]|nr:hypothetical protein [Microbacteriaceae bacterium K1510]
MPLRLSFSRFPQIHCAFWSKGSISRYIDLETDMAKIHNKTRKKTQPSIDESALTVGDVIRRLLPYGTETEPVPRRSPWQQCPQWPADVFAAAAGVVHASSCYAEPGIALSRNDAERVQKRARAQAHMEAGRRWAEQMIVPDLAQQHWATLYKAFDRPIDDSTRAAENWKRAALALVAISDEACSGAGFFPIGDDGVANYVWYELMARGSRKPVLALPHSIALLVPNEIACVLPKSLTPNVGCTLRSLTHHVAFLPGKGVVKPEWLVNPGDEVSRRIEQAKKRPSRERLSERVFNILLMPFPYVIHATDFNVTRPAGDHGDGYFTLAQNWLMNGRRRVSANEMADFIGALIENAEMDAGPVHAVILPEGVFNQTIARPVAQRLARRFRHLELFVTGQVIGRPPKQRNVAAQYRLLDGEIISVTEQSKHHRWRLEESQIRQYQLGGIIDPNFIWWEHIDVHNRSIGFSINRHGAIVAALVCEDLARNDPVLPTVAAVGPALVIALLLDGPQLTNRWPGRYATVLAEDPGSSVLTLTSLGMIERSAMPGGEVKPVVGLWKDSYGSAKELVLPRGSHGLVLSLNCCSRHQVTLDHRHKEVAVQYRLGAVRAVRAENPPRWLERKGSSA